MYINTKELAAMINRGGSAVEDYVKLGVLPPHQLKVGDLPLQMSKSANHNKLKTKLWDKEEVLAWMPKVTEYQKKTRKHKEDRAKPAKKAATFKGFIPKLTAPQQTANNAFNLCIG